MKRLGSPSGTGAQQYRALLEGYARRHPPGDLPRRSSEHATLFAGFRAAWNQSAIEQDRENAQSLHDLKSLLPGYRQALSRWREAQEATADDFNILAVLHLTGREIRHSMILAWLLAEDISGLGTHAQGNLGLRLFLRKFALPGEYAAGEYRVRREVSSDESRVDIEVAAKGRFLIHIENKIWCSEGREQTDREWADLVRRARALGIPGEFPDWPVHALFLTPEGRRSANRNFRAVSWRQVADVLDDFALLARPADVRLFAAHYSRVLRAHIVPKSDETEVGDAQEDLQ